MSTYQQTRTIILEELRSQAAQTNYHSNEGYHYSSGHWSDDEDNQGLRCRCIICHRPEERLDQDGDHMIITASQEYPSWLCQNCAVTNQRAIAKRKKEQSSELCTEESHLCHDCQGYFCTHHQHDYSDHSVEPAKYDDGTCVKINRLTLCVGCLDQRINQRMASI